MMDIELAPRQTALRWWLSISRTFPSSFPELHRQFLERIERLENDSRGEARWDLTHRDSWYGVGMIQLLHQTDAVRVGEIQIQPGRQDQRIGSRVLRETIAQARSNGRKYYFSRSENERAYQLYLRLDFQRPSPSDTHNLGRSTRRSSGTLGCQHHRRSCAPNFISSADSFGERLVRATVNP